MNDESHQTPLRWGEVLRQELKADIAAVSREVEVLKATAVSHKDFMLWGAALGLAILSATIYLSQDTKEAVKEVRKDVQSLYRANRPEQRQRRLETPIDPPKADWP